LIIQVIFSKLFEHELLLYSYSVEISKGYRDYPGLLTSPLSLESRRGLLSVAGFYAGETGLLRSMTTPSQSNQMMRPNP